MLRDHGTLHFRASANLVRLIGEELVQSDEAAILELVKNAYDAGAKSVLISLEPISAKNPGYIKIQDDGEGMGRADFERLFMVAGYSERPEEAKTATRVPTGEKGIGRFAAARLGTQLTVLTKSLDNPKALRMRFDWAAFRDKKKQFDEVEIPYEYVPTPLLPKNTKGTVLQITNLHSDWKREKADALRQSLAHVLDPYGATSDFEIFLEVVGSTKLSGPVKQEPPVEPDLELQFKVLSDGSIKRQIVRDNSRKIKEIVGSSAAAKSLLGLGGRFLYYIKRPPKRKTKGLPAGVYVYRDGVRLEPFGSPAADWLGLSEKRAKRAGHAHIVPSRLFGFVEISRRRHDRLRDTTSRQALIDNEVAQSLVTLLKQQLTHLEEKIRTDVSVPRWEVGKRQKAIKLERARLHALGMLSAGLAHEMRQPMQVIRSEADNITARLNELGWSDNSISESQQNIDRNIERINDSIGFIAELARGDIETIDSFDLAEHLQLECKFFSNQCKVKGIILTVNAPATQPAMISRAGFSMVLVNLWINSVEALEDQIERDEKRITISLSKKNSCHMLEVTDNGPGISDDMKENLFKEFNTGKTGGLGIGLYNCNLIVKAHGGTIEYETRTGVGTTFRVTFPDREPLD